jgi:hypothetical protein
MENVLNKAQFYVWLRSGFWVGLFTVLYFIIHDAATKLHNNHNNDYIVFLQIGVSFSFYNNIYNFKPH